MKKILTLSISLFVFLSCSKGINNFVPKVEEGILDLSEWDLEKDGPVKLDGKWKFFWNEIVNPEKINEHNASSFIKVPAVWNDQQVNNIRLPNFGYGTYHTKILLKQKIKYLALKFPSIGSAYDCYINGKKIKTVGKIALTPDSMISKLHPGVVAFDEENPELNIVIHVSNFHYRWAGIWYSITFGKLDDIFKLRENNIEKEFFLFGILIIMFLYHVGLTALRPSEKTPLFFAFFAYQLA